MKKLKKKLIKLIFTRNYIKENRNDIKFNFLRNLNEEPQKLKELEKKIGTFFELPILGSVDSDFVPKDYVPEHYFFSKQRFLILNEIINNENKRITGGLVLSGPHGVGKSYISYLIACYAFINSYPLLYIPRCSNWVRKINLNDKDCDGSALYWLNRFYDLNYDIIDKYESLNHHKKKLEELKEKKWQDEFKNGCSSLQTSIMTLLSKHIETPVVKNLFKVSFIFLMNITNYLIKMRNLDMNHQK
jgi:hypothetical protein